MSGEASNIDEQSPPPYTETKDTQQAAGRCEVKDENPSTALKAGRPSTYFVFGPRGEFFYTNYKTFHSNLTSSLRSLDLQEPHSIAWNDPSCYFVAGESRASSVKWLCKRRPVIGSIWSKAKRKHTEDDAAEQKWNTWFHQNPMTPAESRETVVAFGSGRSFYAASTVAHSWHGIPTQMIAQLEQRWSCSSTRPRHASLGYKDTYVLIWPDGSIDYHLGELYPSLATQLSSPSRKAVAFLSLSPFSAIEYYIEYADGNILYYIKEAEPASRERIKLLRNATMQKRAKEDGVTWTTQFLVANGKEIITVGPETNHTFDLAAEKEKMNEQNAKKLLADAAKAKKNSSDAKKVAVAAVAIAACTIM